MSRCRSCQAEIVWAVTDTGKRMPLDAEPVSAAHRPSGLFVLDEGGEHPLAFTLAAGQPLYRSHFATCPNADQHRKPRGAAG
jgi:hypothetical protein